MRRSVRRRRAHNPAIRRPLSSPVRAGSPPTRTLASATGARAPIKGRARSNSRRLSRLMWWKAGPRARLYAVFARRENEGLASLAKGVFVLPPLSPSGGTYCPDCDVRKRSWHTFVWAWEANGPAADPLRRPRHPPRRESGADQRLRAREIV